jgi:cupin fold WbuC family metalloprotein
MNQILKIDKKLLENLSMQARATPRLRKNYNIHLSEAEPCNRLLNSLEPGTYVQPHCHVDPTKDETMVMVRGRMGLAVFDSNGKIVEKVLMEAGGDVVAVNIPHGVFHTLVSLENGSVFFEAKAGPYCAIQPNEKSSWAPAEGTPEAITYLAALAKVFSV